MAISKTKTLTFLFMFLTTTTLAFMIRKTNALIPYTTPLWELMHPSEDPFKILEQTPLNLPKNLETINLARADWKETTTHHVITLDVPGMKQGDIKIEVEENRVLRVSGEQKPEAENDGDKWHRAERTSGKFWRQFRLPVNADVDKINAVLEDGVLRIKVAKVAQEKKQAKVVDIVGGDGSGEDVRATKVDG